MTTAQPSDEDYLERRSPAYALLVGAERAVAMLLLVALLVLIVTQVFTRYVLHTPLVWTEELARFALMWFTFAAAVFVMARRQHITVVLFSARSNGRVIAALDAFAYTVAFIGAVGLAIGGIQLTMSYAQVKSTTAGIPMGIVYAALAVGMALIAVHAAFNVYLSIRYPQPHQEPEGLEGFETDGAAS